MMQMRETTVAWAGLAVCLVCLTACAELVIPGTLAGAGEYYRYTTGNVARKTMMGSVREVSAATQRALKKMSIRFQPVYSSGGDSFISASTAELDIRIRLQAVTPKTTKVIIDAAKGEVVKDKATAEEIMTQIAAELNSVEADNQVGSRIFVKNNCTQPIEVAVYYLAGNPSSETWKTEGWFALSPGESRHVVDTQAQTVYFHGKTATDDQACWEGGHFHYLRGSRLGFFRVELGASPVDFTQSFGCD